MAVACEARDETRSPVTRHSAVEVTYFALPLGADLFTTFRLAFLSWVPFPP
ncbi:hypothetical protein J4480_01955 [Candidatus Woesearchaeota archaeon]|nr:hypothetical protein [Candidatus Woesearchaeota archaeon]